MSVIGTLIWGFGDLPFYDASMTNIFKGKIVDTKLILLLAAIFGLAGSVILAFSLNRVLSEVRLAVEALATSVESIAHNGDSVVFRGLDTRLKTASRIANSWVRAGLYCLVVSTGLAALNIYCL